MNSAHYDFNVLAPLIKAPPGIISRLGISELNCRFLEQIGLPSNALRFDPYSSKIMTFDCLANPRRIEFADLAPQAQKFVKLLDELTIVGVCGSQYACMPNTGEIHLIDSRPFKVAMESDAAMAERTITYLNSSPQCLMECLCAYKFLRIKIDQPSGPVLTKEAFVIFHAEIARIDPIVLEKQNSYWRHIVDDLDVW